jgi:hypothetical protein
MERSLAFLASVQEKVNSGKRKQNRIKADPFAGQVRVQEWAIRFPEPVFGGSFCAGELDYWQRGREDKKDPSSDGEGSFLSADED